MMVFIRQLPHNIINNWYTYQNRENKKKYEVKNIKITHKINWYTIF